jgi:hypothetical protein
VGRHTEPARAGARCTAAVRVACVWCALLRGGWGHYVAEVEGEADPFPVYRRDGREVGRAAPPVVVQPDASSAFLAPLRSSLKNSEYLLQGVGRHRLACKCVHGGRLLRSSTSTATKKYQTPELLRASRHTQYLLGGAFPQLKWPPGGLGLCAITRSMSTVMKARWLHSPKMSTRLRSLVLPT